MSLLVSDLIVVTLLVSVLQSVSSLVLVNVSVKLVLLLVLVLVLVLLSVSVLASESVFVLFGFFTSTLVRR